MSSSVVVYMLAPDGSAGAITGDHSGTVAYMTVADEISPDGLNIRCEIVGGTSTARHSILEKLATAYSATHDITDQSSQSLCAGTTLHDVQAVRQNPLFDAVVTQRKWADQFILIYEHGFLALGLEFPSNLPDHIRDKVTRLLLDQAKMTDSDAMAIEDLPINDTDAWRPRAFLATIA